MKMEVTGKGQARRRDGNTAIQLKLVSHDISGAVGGDTGAADVQIQT